jgi:C4-dicarboxylate transporter DctM subunit
MTPFVAVGLLFFFLMIGLPIYLSLGFLALLLFWHDGTPLVAFPQLIVDHLNSETLIAIPLFVIAATFMQRGGVANALIECAQAWVGRARGGLALVCVVACTIFAAICGSSVATAVAIG